MFQEFQRAIELLFLVCFFSGYMLLYLLLHALSRIKPNWVIIKQKFIPQLTYGYMLFGILFCLIYIFTSKFLIDDFRHNSFLNLLSHQWLFIAAFMVLLLLLPALHHKAVYSIIHNAIFAGLLMYVIIYFVPGDWNLTLAVLFLIVTGLILNFGALCLIVFLEALNNKRKRHSASGRSHIIPEAGK